MKSFNFNNFLTFKRLTRFIVYTIIAIVIAGVSYSVLLYLHHYKSDFQLFSNTNFGLLGDFVGGVIGTLVAIVAALYIIKSYKKQISQGKKQTFETSFTLMLEMHRKNLQEVEINDAQGNTLTGRKAFKPMVEELEELFEAVDKTIEKKSNSDERFAEWREKRKRMALAHKLSYGYFFYSVDSYFLTIDKNEALYDLCELVRTEIKGSKKLPDELKNLQHHTILGHYYRHLFNMVNWVNAESSLTLKEKQKFCKLIRSQLSDYEEILLYYNSLSSLGEAWNEPLGEREVEQMNLIAKYRLLKNCPYYLYYFGIKPSETYAVEDESWYKRGELFFETDIRLRRKNTTC